MPSKRPFHRVLTDSDHRIYFQLMEAVAKMVTDDMLDSTFIEKFWEEVENAIYIIRKYSANI